MMASDTISHLNFFSKMSINMYHCAVCPRSLGSRGGVKELELLNWFCLTLKVKHSYNLCNK
jgi:hypothetical protein